MRPVFYSSCNELSNWMENNKDPVIGTKAVLNWKEICDLPMTKKENFYYVHFLKEASGNVSLKNIAKPKIIKLLATGEIIPFQF